MISQEGAIYQHRKDHGLLFRLGRVQKNCFCKPSLFLISFLNTKAPLHLTPQVSRVSPQASQLSGTVLTKMCSTRVLHMTIQGSKFLRFWFWFSRPSPTIEAPFSPQLKINSKWNKWSNKIYEFLLQNSAFWSWWKNCVSYGILGWAEFRIQFISQGKYFCFLPLHLSLHLLNF